MLTTSAKQRKNSVLEFSVTALRALIEITERQDWDSTMIRPVRNLLVFTVALVSIFSFAGAQENQTKKTQAKPLSSVSGAEMFKRYCAVWRLRSRCRRPT